MITSDIISPLNANIEEQLVEYFLDKKATSINKAISVNIKDIQSRLETPELLMLPLERYGYIHKTENGTYYLDKKTYRKDSALIIKIVIVLFLFFALVSIFPFILGFLGILFNWK